MTEIEQLRDKTITEAAVAIIANWDDWHALGQIEVQKWQDGELWTQEMVGRICAVMHGYFDSVYETNATLAEQVKTQCELRVEGERMIEALERECDRLREIALENTR